MLIADHAVNRGYYKRMRVYFEEMYPLPSRLLFSGLLYLGIAVFCNRIFPHSLSIISTRTVVGVLSLFCQFLILRLMDELKDADIDDALFSHRPLPSGRVYKADIIKSLYAVISFYLLVNFFLGYAFLTALFVLFYQFLMFRHFFHRNVLERNLPLTLATHNPVVPLMLLHGFFIAALEHNVTPDQLNWTNITLFTLMLWLGCFAWEIARKIRCPQEENAYVTYSQIFGAKKAVLLAWSAQTLAVMIAWRISLIYSASMVFPVILLLSYLIACWGYLLFLILPSPRTSTLRPYAETFMIGLLLAVILGFFFATEMPA